MRQLTLGVRLTDRALLGNFLAGDNPLALAAARELAATAGAGALFVHGAAGSGKTHLLQGLCVAVPGAGGVGTDHSRIHHPPTTERNAAAIT